MRRQLLVGVILAGWAVALAAQDANPADSAGWWIRNYGLMTAQDDPLVGRAEQVFRRVAAAADKKGNRLPKLVMIRGAGDPHAVALPDGSIVMSAGGLRLCYLDVPPADGDARLAFLLGHELAHLAKDDFWHRSAFMALQKYPGTEDRRQLLEEMLKQTDGAMASGGAIRDIVRIKELQADSYGLIYMTVAGYDPAVIVGGGTSFFEQWVRQLPHAVAESGEHPAAADRAVFLKSQMVQVAEELDLFHFGVRLAQLGRYEDAVRLLERFSHRFPGREVFNNLGFCHYALARQAPAFQNHPDSTRFMLPTQLDPVTPARRYELRRQEGPDYLRDPAFRNRIEQAIRCLREAADRDPLYAPARLNLAAALILDRQYAQALAAAEEADKLNPAAASAGVARAVALYLLGESSGLSTSGAAIDQLKEIIGRRPGESAAVYNLSTILAERGRAASAHEARQAFLQIEPAGPYADEVRRVLGLPPPKPAAAARDLQLKAFHADRLSVGEVTDELEKRLKPLRKTPFDVGDFAGSVYRGDRLRVLELDYFLELVEDSAVAVTDPQAWTDRFGPPDRLIHTGGGELAVYRTFALEVADNRVRTVVRFAE